MSFTWLNTQGVASDAGFELQRVGRFSYEYREGPRIMQLGGESLFGNLGVALFGFSFGPGWRNAKWDSPYDDEMISSSHRKQITKNIEAAMAFMRGKAQFE